MLLKIMLFESTVTTDKQSEYALNDATRMVEKGDGRGEVEGKLGAKY
jgi:hypothetical protein